MLSTITFNNYEKDFIDNKGNKSSQVSQYLFLMTYGLYGFYGLFITSNLYQSLNESQFILVEKKLKNSLYNVAKKPL